MAEQSTLAHVKRGHKQQKAAPVGRTFRELTQAELIADMRRFAKETCKSKESAIAFLQEAGIADEHGNLAEMYRV